MDDSLLPLLLPALMKLESLDLTIGNCPYGYFRRMVERAARRERPFDILPAFDSLTMFRYDKSESSLGADPEYIASLLKLTTIRGIYG